MLIYEIYYMIMLETWRWLILLPNPCSLCLQQVPQHSYLHGKLAHAFIPEKSGKSPFLSWSPLFLITLKSGTEWHTMEFSLFQKYSSLPDCSVVVKYLLGGLNKGTLTVLSLYSYDIDSEARRGKYSCRKVL